MKQLSLCLVFLVSVGSVMAQKAFTVTDARDGKTYDAIEFEIPLEGGVSITRSWLVQNATYEVADKSFCYKDEPAYCDKFGRLYTYEGALEACPEGWRIPTRKDWFYLFSLYGGTVNSGNKLMENGESGLNFLMGGFGYEGGYFNKVGLEGNYWDTSNIGDRPDGLITFIRGRSEITLGGIGKKWANSTRCIKEHR